MPARIVEIGGAAAGFCGRLFQHAGDEVLRIELPEHRATRGWTSIEARDLFLHAGKKRIGTEDPDLIHKLMREADVVIAEGAPDQLERWGWGDLSNIRASITPFGMTGPHRDWHASSAVLLAMGGYTYIIGDPAREPLTLPGYYTEYQSGQFAYIAAAACLLHGQPRQIDVSMLEAVLSLSQFTTVMWTCGGIIRTRHGNDFGSLYPINLFPCADGWFYLNVTPGFWIPFAGMMHRPELAGDPRFATPTARLDNHAELDEIIIAQLSSLTKAEIMVRADESRVPTGVMQTLEEVLADIHLNARHVFQSVSDSAGREVRVPGPAFRSDPNEPLALRLAGVQPA